VHVCSLSEYYDLNAIGVYRNLETFIYQARKYSKSLGSNMLSLLFRDFGFLVAVFLRVTNSKNSISMVLNPIICWTFNRNWSGPVEAVNYDCKFVCSIERWFSFTWFTSSFFVRWHYFAVKLDLFRCKRIHPLSSGNAKEGCITVPLTSCLTGLESAVWQLTLFVFICETD